MQESNQEVSYPGEEILKVVSNLTGMQQTLHRIISFYAVSVDEQDSFDEVNFIKELGNAVLDYKFDIVLTNSIQILAEPFDEDLGEDDMSDLERAAESAIHWTSSDARFCKD